MLKAGKRELMVRKLTFGIVFLLLISFSLATLVSQSGYIGNHKQNQWTTGNSVENVNFVGGDNQILYVDIPKYANTTYSKININSTSELENVSLEIGTIDGNKEYEYYFYNLVNITKDYYIIIKADYVNETIFSSQPDSNIFRIENNKYLFWVNGSNDYEINRANMMKYLYYEHFLNSTYVTGITELKTNETKDIGKKGIYFQSYYQANAGTYHHCVFTFVGATANDNVSSWSYIADGGGAESTFEIPENNVINSASNGVSDEIGTDTTADEKDNPINFKTKNNQVGGNYGRIKTIVLSSKSTTQSCTSDGSTVHIYDYRDNVDNDSMVVFSQLNENDLTFNGTKEVTGFESQINSWLNTCTADGNGNCQLPFTFYSDSAGILNADIGNTINYSLLYNFTYEDTTFENEENTYTLDVYSIDPLQVDSTFYFNNTGYSPSSFSYETGYKTMSYTMVTPFIGEGITFTAPLYWEVDDNGNISNTSTYNQTVNKINLADCETETNWTKVLDIYTLDEEGNDSDYVTTTINFNANIWYEDETSPQNYSFQFKDAHNYSLCIFPNSTGYVNAIMEYFADGYSNRKYYLDNFSLDYENSQTLNLYNLNFSKSSDVTLYVYDRNTGESIEGAYVKLLRYYPETNKYRIVEIEKTDSNGYSLGKMVVADVFYKFIVEYERDVVYNGAVERIVSLTKQIPVIISGDLLESWRSIDDISGSVTCTESTKTCRFTWSDSSNLVQTASMKVYRVNGYGKTSIVELSSSAVSGSLVYTISENTTGNEYIAVGYIHTNTANSFYTMGEDFIEFRESISDQFGVGALFPMFLLLVVMGAVLLNTGAVGVIVGSLIAIVGGTLIGIIPFGVTTILSFVIMGAILIGKLKS